MARALTATVALLLIGVASGTARAAGLFDPALRFRVLRTEHFIIYFHQNEEPMAHRLAAIAEDTWVRLRQPMGVQPPKLTHVVLVDQTDLANGWATPIPRDTIMVTAAWPQSVEFIGDTDDWLRLVFTHEFTHIVHLDRSESWARVVRAAFGRMEIAFPNLFLPTWQIEGLATYQESRITGAGRLHAGDFRAVVNEAASVGRLEPLDRVNGGLTDWPTGNAPYAYGLGFHQYLSDRFGADTLATLAEATARRVPFTGSRAFKRVYGESLGTLWREYEASIARPLDPPAVRIGDPIRVTEHGFIVSGPRFDRPDCESCAPAVVYSMRTPHQFPALNRIVLDGSKPRQLTTRYLGATTAIGRDELYFDQQDLRRNVGLYSDLFALSRTTGRVRRLTDEARIIDPDLSPDGRTLVAIQVQPGRRDLVLVRLDGASGIETLISEADTQFDAPRWSPDGTRIAVERHRPGHLSEIVIVDVAARSVRVVFSDARARAATPAWRPDGAAIVFAMAPQDEVFNLIELSIGERLLSRPISFTTGGATWPDISPDGRTIVFVGYSVDGFDLFTMPYPPGTPSDPHIPSPAGEVVGAEPAAVRPARPYSPWPTLVPTSWTPIVESDSTQLRVGAATGGFDVLGYHAYAASATWLVSRTSDAPAPAAATPDWDLYYAYDRWRPVVWLAASNSTSFFAGPPTDEGVPTAATLRERRFEGGVVVPISHVRVSHVATASITAAVDEYTLPSGNLSRDRTALRGAWATTSAHTYGYSVSAERGITVGVTAEAVPQALGSFANASAFTVDARAYVPGLARHHQVAIRAAAGTAAGDRDVRRTFHLGGSGPNASTIDFGRNAISLLRGFGTDTFAGSRVALLNADYRFPIARPQRGIGTWPFFLHTIHGALFADAGHAWTRTFRSDAIKTSAGAELSTDIVAGYSFRFTATAGIAWAHDGSGTVPGGAALFARIGRAF